MLVRTCDSGLTSAFDPLRTLVSCRIGVGKSQLSVVIQSHKEVEVV